MSTAKHIVMALAWFSASVPSYAADFSDPTWPCVQRKVEDLSLGLMWPHQIDDTPVAETPTLQSEINEIAGLLALRRIELDELQPQLAAFATRHGGDPAVLGLVFQRTFDTLAKRRKRILSGIGEFSLKQIDLAEKIDLARAEMDQALTTEQPDYDKVDALEEQLDWDQLIYSDRQRSITYLCETPQIIERRLFAISQMLQQLASDQG
ncbi:hypothetical protein HW561_12975 [Rhodobacteraceae bacterium B1Z28]|uniref:Uncharacterized protein n=1 Tax=Ruegeria haliotis TaxID=2747601 RepID=A0ABX2PRB0_9RHOB|nr:hypothetical protein [Ruegeria haliotis]NVO56698.1 hypothetical protein [Ruegeria haliotis]